ncbi:MAG TPA: methyltransferase domain-containing protein [Steroidobacteraceae bacterium]|nr:methyltransferase domain-containing protein [Steroidobacteraceae bacterium]
MHFTRTPTAAWLESPLGQRVLRAEAVLAGSVFDDVFGFELLQVGSWGAESPLLTAARTQHTTVVAACAEAGVTLCAALDALPFGADSIDAVLLPHSLERVEDPYAVLREAERVLRAEGCLLICGFNPWSGWGVRRAFGLLLRWPPYPPGTRRLLSERRLRDWVALLGFDVERVYGYLGAGAYWLKARKRVATLTLLKPRRRVRRSVLVAAPEARSQASDARR